MKKQSYTYATKIGVFKIIFNQLDNCWHVLHQDEDLGSYATPDQAADDLAGGHTTTPSSGYNTELLRIPSSVADWD